MTHYFDTRCWQQERVGQVINTQALNIVEPLFLATHAPFDFLEVKQARRALSEPTENALLDDLLRSAREDEHAFVAVQGIPGTGKSNLIRWLYLRYKNSASSGETVLLIERQNNSLRTTLLRVMEIFGDAAFEKQRELLEKARTQLEGRSLHESIVSSFHTLAIAVREGKHTIATLPPDHLLDRTPDFLLDPTVRAHLIDRRVKKIAGQLMGMADRPDEGERFFPDDFKFSIDDLNTRIRKSVYADVKGLADELYQEVETRQQMAHYLNQLLTSAVERTLSLSASEFKQMFDELRRAMFRSGKSLVLFIEDITAFSGLDAGLVDVLTTEHRGGTGLCRMTSVIGITDYYFNERLPDNMRDRLTMRIIVPAPTDQQPFLLSVAARHLNAIRLEAAEVEQWERHDTIACDECPVRQRCHETFGTVKSDDGRAIGLFPFNVNALTTMYQQLSSDSFRTPRGFLIHVLNYVLQSAGDTIPAGRFPPRPNEVGSQFTSPSLRNPAQRSVIDRIAAGDRERILSLVQFWGDRTLDDMQSIDRRTIGGLPEEVFNVFGIGRFSGEKSDAQFDEPTAVLTSPIPYVQSEPLRPQIEVPIATLRPIVRGKLSEAIEGWLNNDERLAEHNKLKGLLITYLSEAIDWEAHRVPPALIDDHLRPANFFIDGQPAKASGNPFTINRSPETAALLHALDELGDTQLTLPDETIGAHLVALTHWLHSYQDQIIAFVMRLSEDHPMTTDNAVARLAHLSFWVVWLTGGLTPKAKGADALYHAVLQAYLTNRDPLPSIPLPADRRARVMEALTRYIVLSTKNPTTIIDYFLKALNCPQGRVGEVKFIDAARALDALDQVAHYGFQDSLAASKPAFTGGMWDAIWVVHTKLETEFDAIWDGESQALVAVFEALSQLQGADSAEAVFAIIDRVNDTVIKLRLPFKAVTDGSLNARGLDAVMRRLNTRMELSGQAMTLWMSRAPRVIVDAQHYQTELQKFVAALKTPGSGSTQDDTRSVPMIDDEVGRVVADYGRLLEKLDAFAQGRT